MSECLLLYLGGVGVGGFRGAVGGGGARSGDWCFRCGGFGYYVCVCLLLVMVVFVGGVGGVLKMCYNCGCVGYIVWDCR